MNFKKTFKIKKNQNVLVIVYCIDTFILGKHLVSH